MTTHIREESYQVVATEDLLAAALKYKAITLNGTIAADTRLAAGLLRTSVQSGGHATAVYAGLTKVWAAGAVGTPGFPLTITTSGFAAVCVSGGYSVGRFLATCASGDLVPAAVDFTNLAYQSALP